MSKYIVFVGTQSVGKSTTSKAAISFLEEFYGSPVHYVTEIGRKLHSQGHTINSQSTSTTQRLIEAGYAEEEKKHADKILLADRSVIDRLSYTLLSKAAEDKDLVAWYEKNIVEMCSRYSHIFYIPLSDDVKLELDGVRSADENFRKDIDSMQQAIINKYNIKVTKLNGSTEQRLEQIKLALVADIFPSTDN